MAESVAYVLGIYVLLVLNSNTGTAVGLTVDSHAFALEIHCHSLGWILVESIELTDKCSRLHGPPRDRLVFSHTTTDIKRILARLWIES